MKKSRRWLLIFAALIGLMAHAHALRAGFPKAPTSTTATTTTTTEAPDEDEVTDAVISDNSSFTKTRSLTGIPQIDYVWDPNLPRELNGYNLSDYPFLNSVPTEEDIEFRCNNSLHDGFYASIKFKCQLYHHCLYGVRHDFLCANFTAFDQKTFICHFASEVDCKNSPKYWSRNEPLYKATTTPSTTTTSTAAPITEAAPPRRRPLRRPLRRRRPQVDYYYYDEDYDDDYVEERSNRRRKQRPRTRRPDYEDDYDTQRAYGDDERFDKRPYNRDRSREDPDDVYEKRGPDRSRNRKRPANRRPDDEDEVVVERRKPIDRRRPNNDRRIPASERRPVVDIDDPIEERRPVTERRPLPGRRQPVSDRKHLADDRRSFSEDRRKPRPTIDDDFEDEEDIRPVKAGRRRINPDRRPVLDDDLDRPLRHDEESEEQEPGDLVAMVKPTGTGSGSIFDRPRVPPKINRPVPLTERKKFQFTTKKTTTAAPLLDDDYYDDYDDPLPRPQPVVAEEKPEKASLTLLSGKRDSKRPVASAVSAKEDLKTQFEDRKPDPLDDEDYDDRSVSKYRSGNRDNIKTNLKREETEDYDFRPPLRNPERDPFRISSGSRFDADKSTSRDSDRNSQRHRDQPLRSRNKEPVDVRHTPIKPEDAFKSSEEDEPAKDVRPIVRVVKRPFLPSRGGSPYLPRGLQPVGAAQLITTPAPPPATTTTTSTESTPIDMGSTVSGIRLLEHSAPIVRGAHNDYPPIQTGPRTTQKPQIEHPRTSLDDIYENEYDVTLNDALNPTLKPLTPKIGLPSGFSHSNKYDRSRFSSPSGSYSIPSDSVYSSTDFRSTIVQSPPTHHYHSRTHHLSRTRGSHTYYNDYDTY